MREGGFALFPLEASVPGPWRFVRRAEDQKVVALFNFPQESLPAAILASSFTAPALRDLWDVQIFIIAHAGQPYTVTLPGAGTIRLAVL